MFLNDWIYLIWSEWRKHLKHVTSLKHWLGILTMFELGWTQRLQNHFILLNTSTRWGKTCWVCLTQEWMKKHPFKKHGWSLSKQWNKMVINGEYIDISGIKIRFNLIKVLKHWRMVNYWLCMPQCAQTKFQIMSQHWNAGMETKDWLSRSRVDDEAF